MNRARARDDDFEIDFSKHTRELNKAIESDERYWRENDAKFRAVHQKVGSYDEFRDIVKAAHLKPLEKGDRISEMKQKFHQPWNICAKKDGNDASSAGPPCSTSEFPMPTTSLEFARDWKRFKDDDQKFSYVSAIPMDRLRHLFQNDTGFGLMGELISLLSKQETLLDRAWTIELLEILSHSDRFTLSLQFFSYSEREACWTLIEKLEMSSEDDLLADRVAMLYKKYDIQS